HHPDGRTTERGRRAISLRTPSPSQPRPETGRTAPTRPTGGAERPSGTTAQAPDPASAAPLPRAREGAAGGPRPAPSRPGPLDRRAPAASPARLHAGEPPDRLRPYQPLVTIVRWGTVLVGVVRTALPPSWRVRADGPTAILAETAGCYAAVALTGWWSSPFVFTVASGLVEAGFAGGFVWAVPLAGAVSAAVTLPSFRNTDSVLRLATQGSAEFLLTAMVAGYGRRL